MEPYDFWGPLLWLGCSFIGTSVVCEGLHYWNPIWYQKRIIVYPNDKKEKQRQHVNTKVFLVVLLNILLSCIVLPTAWILRLHYCGQNGVHLSHALFWISDAMGITTQESSFRRAINFPLELFLLEKISQLWFFHAHYIVHRVPVLYRIVHKFHHQHKEPSVLTAIHCTIWEMLLLNLPAVALGPLLVLPHPFIHTLWYILAGLYTPIVHSGYHLCSWFDPQYHDEHHRNPSCNFGSRLLDRWYACSSPSSNSGAQNNIW